MNDPAIMEPPMEQHATGRAGRIDRIIREHLAPVELTIHDDSARHAHHVHVRDNGVQAGKVTITC